MIDPETVLPTVHRPIREQIAGVMYQTGTPSLRGLDELKHCTLDVSNNSGCD